MTVNWNLRALEINLGGFTIFPTLIWNEKTAILVDTGMPGLLPVFKNEMSKLDVPFERLSAIILTHQDLDHIGSLPELTTVNPNLSVFAHEVEKPYIEGELPLIKTNGENMTAEKWAAIPDALKPLYENPPTAKVTNTLEDGAEVEGFPGIEVIATPGHTPGHVSLYVKQTKTLIAGDALTCSDGNLLGPAPQHTLNMDEALASVAKLLNYDIETVICYHGGIVSGKILQQLTEIIGK